MVGKADVFGINYDYNLKLAIFINCLYFVEYRRHMHL